MRQFDTINTTNTIICFRAQPTADEKALLERDYALSEQVETLQRRICDLLGFVGMIAVYCGSCMVSHFHELHKEAETEDAVVYRKFTCGRRGIKYQNLR